jgi:hypothetical protein
LVRGRHFHFEIGTGSASNFVFLPPDFIAGLLQGGCDEFAGCQQRLIVPDVTFSDFTGQPVYVAA